MRQAYFVRFEKLAHQMVGDGATGDQLAKAYLGELRQQFGKAVKVPDEFQWEWLSIPHIFASPFYCYAYSFGNLLVLALYRMYKEQGAAFVPKYLELLETGGSEAPRDILAKVGVDMTAEAFWQSGLTLSTKWSSNWKRPFPDTGATSGQRNGLLLAYRKRLDRIFVRQYTENGYHNRSWRLPCTCVFATGLLNRMCGKPAALAM